MELTVAECPACGAPIVGREVDGVTAHCRRCRGDWPVEQCVREVSA